jgi:hypothetical protein
VQKLADLLGENVAENEATLNSIIESLSGSEQGDERVKSLLVEHL